MVTLTAADIVGTKAVGSDKLAPLKLRILVLTCSVIIGLLMYIFNLGESGLTPWDLAMQYPLISIAILCIAFSEFLYQISLRYMGMSIMEAISGLEGVFVCLGLVIFNSFTGQLNVVQDMFVPLRLILICIILIFAFLLPNVEIIMNGNLIASTGKLKEKHNIAIGIIIALLAAIITSGDSLISDAVLGTQSIGYVDYVMTGLFLCIIPLPIFCIVYYHNCKDCETPGIIVRPYYILYVIFYMANSFTGLLAISIDAVRSEIMYLTYPVIAILSARIVLKEKYTWKQNLCIWIITLATLIFCMIDYME